MENDYQSTVYSWFDKSGIISNIRTHLRHNLVSALKNKDLAQKIGRNTPKSAKQYVYDMLVAEYLWNHNYVYTLSVLTSEAPLLVNFSQFMKPSNDEESSNDQQKLQNDYIVHALETLGINPDECQGKDIIKDYSENDIPLLLCILYNARTGNNIFYGKNVSQYHPKLNNAKHQSVQTRETGESIYQEISKISLAQKKLLRQKELFDAQLKQKETELKEQSSLLEKQLLLLQDKLDQAQKIMQAYNLKEKRFNASKRQENLRILQKENELIEKEKVLSQEADRLEKERNSHRVFEDNLKKLQDELSNKVRRDIPRVEHSCNLSIKDAQTQTEFGSFILDRNERNFLNQEKQDLNGLVQEQQSRINQLNSRVLCLTRKLEEVQLKHSPTFEMPSVIKVLNTNTVLSENSSTDDILRDAKMRLTRLEKESERAEQSYHNFFRNLSK